MDIGIFIITKNGDNVTFDYEFVQYDSIKYITGEPISICYNNKTYALKFDSRVCLGTLARYITTKQAYYAMISCCKCFEELLEKQNGKYIVFVRDIHNSDIFYCEL